MHKRLVTRLTHALGSQPVALLILPRQVPAEEYYIDDKQ